MKPTVTLPDISAPAKALVQARDTYNHLLAEKTRLIEKSGALKRAESETLKAANLADPATYERISDLRLTGEICAHKLTALEKPLAGAAAALKGGIRQFGKSTLVLSEKASAEIERAASDAAARARAPFEPVLKRIAVLKAGALDYQDASEPSLVRYADALLKVADDFQTQDSLAASQS